MKLARITSVTRHKPSWRDGELFLASTWHGGDEDRRMDKYYGSITLSFKTGKKRVLVKGRIRVDFDPTRYGLWCDWYFVPKPQHQAKLLDALK